MKLAVGQWYLNPDLRYRVKLIGVRELTVEVIEPNGYRRVLNRWIFEHSCHREGTKPKPEPKGYKPQVLLARSIETHPSGLTRVVAPSREVLDQTLKELDAGPGRVKCTGCGKEVPIRAALTIRGRVLCVSCGI